MFVENQNVRQADAAFVVLREHRSRLVDLTGKLSALFERLGQTNRAEALAQLRSRLESDHFKVMVLGEFKRGKSTFINALLGEDLLPAKVIPCTAVITEIKWGREKKAVVHFRHPVPERLPERMPEEILRHLRRAGRGQAPPLEVPIDRLRQYIEISDPEKDQKEAVAETPYERVEIWWPLELCKNGVEIIDSPGLNEHEARARITADYLHQADAVLFTMLCMPFGSLGEFRFIDRNLWAAGYQHIFYLCNRWDEIPHREREDVRRMIHGKLRERTKFAESGIFMLSALDALRGRLEGDPQRLEISGIQPFEKALARFLTEERGRIKLLQPATELSNYARELHLQIPSQRRMLDENLADLVARVERAQPQLDTARRRNEQTLRVLEIKREALRQQIRSEAERLLRRFAGEVSQWVQEIETEAEIALLTTKPVGQVEELIKEIVEKVQVRFEEGVQTWSTETVKPIIDQWSEEVQKELERRTEDFFLQLEEIYRDLHLFETPEAAEVDGASEEKRRKAARLGLLLGPVVALQGLTIGFKGLATTALSQFVMALVVGFLGISFPFALAAVLVTGLLAGKWGAVRFERELRSRLGNYLMEKLNERAEPAGIEIADRIDVQAQKEIEKVKTALDRELAAIRDQIQPVLNAKRAGDAQAAARRKLLDEVEKAAVDIDAAIRQTILAVAGAA